MSSVTVLQTLLLGKLTLYDQIVILKTDEERR